MRILRTSVETEGERGEKMNPCYNLLNPVEHQVKTNLLYFPLTLPSPQYKRFLAQSGKTGVPTGPTVPWCGRTSLDKQTALAVWFCSQKKALQYYLQLVSV